jgi:DNA invertase Pin-like site-specific DNA recombinase
MNLCTLQDESSAARCLSLIERNAPRMMKTGGGRLVTDQPNVQHPLTEEGRLQIIALAATADTVLAIAAATGWSGATVRKVLNYAGLPTPYLRQTGLKKGAPVKLRGSKQHRVEELINKLMPSSQIAHDVGCSYSTVRLVRARMLGSKWAQKQHAPDKRVGPRHSKILAQ